MRPKGSTGFDDQFAVKADIDAPTDYQLVVKEGDLTFTTPTSPNPSHVISPYKINTELTGQPVAKSSNEGSGESGVNINFVVPEGQTGIFSLKGVTHGRQPNGFYLWLDDDANIFSDCYAHETEADWPFEATAVIPEGEHFINVQYLTQMDWYSMGGDEKPSYGYFYDVALTTAPTRENAAILLDEKADAGRCYSDRYAAQGSTIIDLLNSGTSELRLLGSEGSAHFTALCPDTAQFAEKLPVTIRFSALEEGDYAETLTLKTTAGDFTLPCSATVEKIPTDYNAIVAEGLFSFDTSREYPFAVDNETKCATNTNAGDHTGIGTWLSWLEARFEVPEGEKGTLAFDAHNASDEVFTFMQQSVLVNGSEFFIDGQSVGIIGGDVDCGSLDMPEELLLFGPGQHSIRFQFQNKAVNESKLANTLTVSNLGLKLAASSIADVHLGETPVKVEYFNAAGQRLSAPCQGVNIIRRTYADGTAKVVKRIK